MPIRTEESLKQLFAESRARNEKKKKLQEQKYKNAQESIKKALAKQQSTKDKKTPQNAQEQQITAISRIISIYNSKYIERFIGEDDLYQTREELEEAMPHCINWDKWNELVNKTKKDLKKK
jgi:hypothetical protein